MKLFDTFDQYSDDWWTERRGIPTASEFKRIITPTGKLSASADGYIAQLIGDILDPEYPRKDTIATAAMRRGTFMEDESRRFFEMERNATIKQVGFVKSDDGRFGSSPDGVILIDEKPAGILELKNHMPAAQIENLMDGILPKDHAVQCHGHLAVSGLPLCVLCCYSPGCPALIVDVVPNEFTEKLRKAMDEFHTRYQETLDRVRKMGTALELKGV